jgi:hypothetical protein
MLKKIYRVLSCFLILLTFILIIAPSIPALAAGTTSLTITKYAGDGSTIIDQVTISYQEMRDSLPVVGDGITHQWLQGPVFEGDKWDPSETINIKDWGANKGTDIKDLCELVGGMSPGDTVQIKATDGLSRTYDYPNVYTPDPRQGKMVICWWNNGTYVPDFADGMRLVFFAQTTNSEGKYVFGNRDQHECFPENRWYFYNGEYPTTTGHSVKYVNEINIYVKPSNVDSRCFIATAVYGTPIAEQLDVLREFRDELLLQSSVGSKFVALYYQLSPPVAGFISRNNLLRTLVREFVVDPIVRMVEATRTVWQN